MNCPACKNAMITLELADVEIDHCVGCGGIWLDAGELELLMEAPEEAKLGGHGTSEYYMIRDFLEAIEKGTRPPIDVMRSMDFTIPGIIAHESAMSDGNWRDVPQFDW